MADLLKLSTRGTRALFPPGQALRTGGRTTHCGDTAWENRSCCALLPKEHRHAAAVSLVDSLVDCLRRQACGGNTTVQRAAACVSGVHIMRFMRSASCFTTSGSASTAPARRLCGCLVRLHLCDDAIQLVIRQQAQPAPLHHRYLDVLAAGFDSLHERSHRQFDCVAPRRLYILLLQELANLRCE